MILEKWFNKTYTFEDFLAIADHDWIRESAQLKKAFKELYGRLPYKLQAMLFFKDKLRIIVSDGQYAIAFGHLKDVGFIIIYPELLQRLHSSAYLEGIAMLAHELGHHLLGHTKSRSLDPLTAQCEADEFAFHLGLGLELHNAILDFTANRDRIDLRVRLARLTSLLIASRARASIHRDA